MTRRWIKEGVVLAVHDEQIAEHGGLIGVQDAGMLSLVLMRPQPLWFLNIYLSEPEVISISYGAKVRRSVIF
jgi:hypothetical protein